MKQLDVFRSLTGVDSRLGFYTSESDDKIPEVPGCYAWFLPLWIYREDIDELMKFVGDLLSYEKNPEKQVDARFTWESVKLRLHRNNDVQIHDQNRATWKKALDDMDAKDALQQVLIEASLLMPPLYVGRTNNLKRRYLEHTSKDLESSTFSKRFGEYVETLDHKIRVNDLLFVCIRTSERLNQVFDKFGEKDLNALVEQILLQSCRPPFSMR